MQKYAVIEKKIGETPLQALENFRATDSRLAGVPMTYAGRLDPMAEGKLLILIGDECKNRKAYDGLDKEYEFEILFGFASDTGDVLGLASRVDVKEFSEKELNNAAQTFVGTIQIPYPIYSSKTVDGKPLFEHVHKGTISTIEIPTADVRVYRIQLCEMRSISGAEVIEKILSKIQTLRAEADPARPGSDFRKEKILARWREIQKTVPTQCTIAKFKAVVSSGMYIRSLAPMIAEKLDAGGLALSIRRTKIGRYMFIGKHFGLWKNP